MRSRYCLGLCDDEQQFWITPQFEEKFWQFFFPKIAKNLKKWNFDAKMFQIASAFMIVIEYSPKID